MQAAYVELAQEHRGLIPKGLAAAAHTQTTDVEVEVNGLMTYDRAKVKMDAAKAAELNRSVSATPLEAAMGAAPVK